MDKSVLEGELQKQAKAIKAWLGEECKPRFAARHLNFDLPLQLIHGVRGAGKTFTIVHALAKAGKNFAYIDLSHLGHSGVSIPFEDLYESLAMVYGSFSAVIIDECASYEGIEEIFKGFVANEINVIGIYSGMQPLPLTDADVPYTTFYPLSFSEYCIWHGIDAEEKSPVGIAAVRKAFNDFLKRGGFPATQDKVRLKKTKEAIENAIIENDIKGAFRKDKIQELQDASRTLIDHSSALINYKLIADTLGIGSEITAKKYVEAVKESGCLYTIARFGQFSKQRTILEKEYVADPIFITEDDRQKRLEVMVYMQLRRFCERHGYRMHYYANRTTECDFALCSNYKMRTIIQVIADYSDSELIKEKVKGLIAMSKATGCNRLFILTDSAHDTIEAKDLVATVVPVFEFLLDRSHKIVTE